MRKKILSIMHLPPPIHGAAIVGKLIKESNFLNEKFDITYVNLSTSQTLNAIGEKEFKKIFSFVRVISSILELLRSKKYDLCYMTITAKGSGFYKDFIVVCVLKLFRKNIIYHFHNKGVRLNSVNFLKRGLYNFVFRNTKAILLSKNLYKDVSSFYLNDQIYYCANGIIDVDFNFEKPETYFNKNRICKFLFLSNMMKEKGLLVLLEACKILKEKEVSFECHFVGAWSDVTESVFWKKVADLKIGDVVFAYGEKYGEEKYSFLKEADVFVFPTYYHNEVFPLVILEAMQANLPVISTFEGGIPEMIVEEKTGFLVKQKDVEDLVSKMEIMVENPKLRKAMGKAGFERYTKNFTKGIFENNIYEIFEEA